jgi:hypothetical protein
MSDRNAATSDCIDASSACSALDASANRSTRSQRGGLFARSFQYQQTLVMHASALSAASAPCLVFAFLNSVSLRGGE